jgi:hypothetical protein
MMAALVEVAAAAQMGVQEILQLNLRVRVTMVEADQSLLLIMVAVGVVALMPLAQMVHLQMVVMVVLARLLL